MSNMSWATSSPGMAISSKPEGGDPDVAAQDAPSKKTKVVVVGLGMVGIAFV